MPGKNGEAARSEDDVLLLKPETVVLGGKPYQVRPLTIAAQAEWREKFFDQFSDLLKDFELGGGRPSPRGWLSGVARLLHPQPTETERFLDALRVAFLRFPERIADAFFSYAPYLPRAEIERTATEAELVRAFTTVWKLAFPFFEMLQGAVAMARTAQSPLARPTS